MRRKLAAIGLCLVMLVVMPACGPAVETSVDLPHTDTEEVQGSMNIPEEENAEAAQEIPEEVVEDDSECWADDMVIAFPDASFKERIQKVTGIKERDITYGDVKNITTFSMPFGYDYACDSLDVLKYFDSLQDLYLVVTSQNALSEIGVLSHLKNLERLYIYSIESDLYYVDDISAIGELNNLKELRICVDGIEDFTPIYKLENLQRLELYSASRAEFDLSQMASLENMRELDIFTPPLDGGGLLVKDVSCLSRCQNMEELYFSISGECNDLSAFVCLPEAKVDLCVVLEPEKGNDLSTFVSAFSDFARCLLEKKLKDYEEECGFDEEYSYDEAYDEWNDYAMSEAIDWFHNLELYVSLELEEGDDLDAVKSGLSDFMSCFSEAEKQDYNMRDLFDLVLLVSLESEGVDLNALRSLSGCRVRLYFNPGSETVYLGDIFKNAESLELVGNFNPQMLENCEFPQELCIYDNERLTNLNFLLTSAIAADEDGDRIIHTAGCNNLTDTSAAEQAEVSVR